MRCHKGQVVLCVRVKMYTAPQVYLVPVFARVRRLGLLITIAFRLGNSHLRQRVALSFADAAFGSFALLWIKQHHG